MKKMFVIDSDYAFVEALSLFFKEKYDVYGFHTIHEITKSKENYPHVILLDLLPPMRSKDIIQLVNKVKNTYSNIPILLTSTCATTLLKAKSLGITELLEKPFDATMLQKKVATLALAEDLKLV